MGLLKKGDRMKLSGQSSNAQKVEPVLSGYLLAVMTTGAALALRLAFSPYLGAEAPLLIFIVPVLLSAWRGGIGPGLLATLLGMLAGKFFLVAPLHSFAADQPHDIVALALFCLVGLLVTGLGDARRRAVDIAERRGEVRHRAFLKETLFGASEGRLRLCDTRREFPKPLTPVFDESLEISLPNLGLLRHHIQEVADKADMPSERAKDLIAAVGEAAMNAMLHGGGGKWRVYVDTDRCRIQVWIRDRGTGIDDRHLHRATLEKGFSTAGTLGCGFWMMLGTADRVYLMTSRTGTTVVLEQEKAPPEPAWLKAKAL